VLNHVTGVCPHTVKKSRGTILISVLFGIGWAASIGFGMRLLVNHETTPGSAAIVSAQFPADSPLSLASDRLTLVMLAHPRCPCTRASIGELAQIMAEGQGKLKAYVVFSRPEGAGADWNETGAWRSAAEIPGVTPVGDDDGRETRRFGAETSGHTLLFARDGRLLFSGGITASRGHAGDNAGESAIVALVREQAAPRATTPVFGCKLVAPTVAAADSVCLK
jgi:hypothetical protein